MTILIVQQRRLHVVKAVITCTRTTSSTASQFLVATLEANLAMEALASDKTEGTILAFTTHVCNKSLIDRTV